MTSVLQLKNLHKNFGGVIATDNVSLDVVAGELHAIIGPNGAGKTTLIAQLSGAVKPDSGSILFNGRDISGRPAHARAGLGIARSFQITSLVMQMSVLDNVALAVQAKQGHSFKFLKAAREITGIREPAYAMLEEVGLGHRANDPTAELSHGEHRLMEIAIALATGAEFLMLDEPMAGLGPEESSRMVELLKTLKSKKTILLIEHDRDEVFALADRISVLVYGQIIATGAPDEIRGNEAVRHAYLGED